jgi:hypothetical protein
MDLFDRLKDLREQGLAEIKEAESEKSLNDVRVKLVGKKGETDANSAPDEGRCSGKAAGSRPEGQRTPRPL